MSPAVSGADLAAFQQARRPDDAYLGKVIDTVLPA